VSFIRCDDCGGVCRGGDKCPARAGVPVSDLDAVAGRVENFAVLLRENPRIFIGLEADLRTLLAALAEAKADAARLDWLERTANGVPVEVDAFTGMVNPETDDVVFLTQYLLADSVRLGQGRTLRAAIDAARGGEAGT
jgi:hypothetical protein